MVIAASHERCFCNETSSFIDTSARVTTASSRMSQVARLGSSASRQTGSSATLCKFGKVHTTEAAVLEDHAVSFVGEVSTLLTLKYVIAGKHGPQWLYDSHL